MSPLKLDKPTIKALFSKQVIDLVDESVFEILELRKTTIDKISSAKHLSVEELKELIYAIQDQLEDEILGLFHRPIPLNSFPTIYKALSYMPNVDHVIHWLNDYYSLYNKAPPYLISETPTQITITLNDKANSKSKLPIYSEFVLVSLYKSVCRLCRVNFPLTEVGLSFPIKGIEDDLSYLFASKNIICSEISYIRFSKDIMNLPIYPDDSFDNSTLYSYFLTWIEENNIASKVRKMVENQVPLCFPTLEAVAKEFNMSPQTLRRKLSENDASYQIIKDSIRKDRAISLLMNPNIPIKKVALDLGFADPAAFSKAFKNWFITTPTSYREKYFKR